MLRYSPLSAAEALSAPKPPYRRFEDLLRDKWTWDRVVRGTHGTNCAGTCAFNVYVKNGIVWREEQQGEYGPSGDAPDYGPRGCQKGLRHAKYMYGKQRVLYPMKRVGARGQGKWERISWERAASEIADRIIDVSVEYGPESISLGSGTQLSVKLASAAALFHEGRKPDDPKNMTGKLMPGMKNFPSFAENDYGKVVEHVRKLNEGGS